VVNEQTKPGRKKQYRMLLAQDRMKTSAQMTAINN